MREKLISTSIETFFLNYYSTVLSGTGAGAGARAKIRDKGGAWAKKLKNICYATLPWTLYSINKKIWLVKNIVWIKWKYNLAYILYFLKSKYCFFYKKLFEIPYRK